MPLSVKVCSAVAPSHMPRSSAGMTLRKTSATPIAVNAGRSAIHPGSTRTSMVADSLPAATSRTYLPASTTMMSLKTALPESSAVDEKRLPVDRGFYGLPCRCTGYGYFDGHVVQRGRRQLDFQRACRSRTGDAAKKECGACDYPETGIQVFDSNVLVLPLFVLRMLTCAEWHTHSKPKPESCCASNPTRCRWNC